MGSHMKKTIFDEQTSKALKKWHMAVKKKPGRGGKSPTRTLGGNASPTSSMMGSPFHPTGAMLQRYKTTGHSTRGFGYEEDATDLEDPSTHPPPTASLIIRSDPLDHDHEHELDHDDDIRHLDAEHDDGFAPNGQETTRNEDDFSFVRPVPTQK